MSTPAKPRLPPLRPWPPRAVLRATFGHLLRLPRMTEDRLEAIARNPCVD